jgi:hypothetical protein
VNANTAFRNLERVRVVPGTTAARRVVRWQGMTNKELKFTLDVLSAHDSPFEEQALQEVARRIDAGVWLDLDNPPPPLHNLPWWLQKWPFRLLWKQRD